MGNFFNKKNFKGINEESFKTFSLEGLNTYCCILSIYDGDTCTIGFKWKGELFKTKIRMLGYDSPEMKPRLNVENREQEIQAAHRAKFQTIQRRIRLFGLNLKSLINMEDHWQSYILKLVLICVHVQR